jgi:hypothetical protein
VKILARVSNYSYRELIGLPILYSFKSLMPVKQPLATLINKEAA